MDLEDFKQVDEALENRNYDALYAFAQKKELQLV
jgi:hypothetical protein